MLLPHALQDWLPEGHLAYYISDAVDSLDLSAFHARYAGGGPRNQPFHPAMMVKVLVYGYATGVFSSRKLARKLHEDVAFRVLAAGNYPAHRTLCDFRAFHLKELSDLFVQVVKLAKECGLVKLGTIAVDGTKIKANASRHKAMSYDRMKKAELELKAQILPGVIGSLCLCQQRIVLHPFLTLAPKRHDQLGGMFTQLVDRSLGIVGVLEAAAGMLHDPTFRVGKILLGVRLGLAELVLEARFLFRRVAAVRWRVVILATTTRDIGLALTLFQARTRGTDDRKPVLLTSHQAASTRIPVLPTIARKNGLNGREIWQRCPLWAYAGVFFDILRRFSAAQTSFHSAWALASPRMLNCRKPRTLFTQAFGGSDSHLRFR